MLAGLCLLLAAIQVGVERPKDLLTLRNGKVVHGHLLYADERRLIVRVGTRDREYERVDVASVESVSQALDEVLGQLDAVDESDAQALLELARYARDHRLPNEARLLAWCAIAAAPQDPEAHAFLEHRKRNGRLHARIGRDEFPVDDLAQPRHWNQAWQFATTHFELRTNLPLEEAVGIALDLERVYRDLMAFLGPELVLHDVLLPMPAEVHADEGSFPEALGGRRSYFLPDTRTLHLNAGKGYDRWTLVHEVTHQVLYCAAEGERAGKGVSLPGWLDEGLAEYMAGNAQGARGRVHARPGGVCTPHFRTHAEADDAYDVSRLLTFGMDDFSSSSNEALKYAQSYTFVHFLLHAEGERHRPALMDFMRQCWGGKSSSGALLDAVDLDKRALQEAWTGYVRDNL